MTPNSSKLSLDKIQVSFNIYILEIANLIIVLIIICVYVICMICGIREFIRILNLFILSTEPMRVVTLLQKIEFNKR